MRAMKDIVTVPGSGDHNAIAAIRQVSKSVNVHVVTSIREARKVLGRMDGLLLVGGADITPWFYGQEPSRLSGPFNQNRDAVEWYLTRNALDGRIPTLGICRGHQMLAVASGGSLFQDIAGEGAMSTHHAGVHRLMRVRAPLSKHIPEGPVNSYHHQAIKTIPVGWQMAAVAPDGVIEALWRPGYLGVQFHPEFLWDTDRRWLTLFEWFLDGLA